MGNPRFIGIIFLIVLPASDSNIVQPRCPDGDTCEYEFVLERRYTMVQYGAEATLRSPDHFRPLVAGEDGKLYPTDCSGVPLQTPLTPQEAAGVATADGSYKLAMMVNGQIPGTPIVVYEGQEVVVKAVNNLYNEATTIHFHGLHQRGTPWMDGGGKVSQCDINPGQTYTYRFRASPVGTHWYHSHIGVQRSMGLNGPLIVLPDPKMKSKNDFNFENEFYLVVTDWYEESSTSIFHRFQTGGVGYELPGLKKCFSPPQQRDGMIGSSVSFYSALINGKGWLYDKETGEPTNTNQPLEEFHVTRGHKFRFRFISSAMMFGFRLSIDSHKLHVIATDGRDVKPKSVDSIVIQSGERYDFYINADDPDNTGTYWIRAETLNQDKDDPNKQAKGEHVEAVLRYTTTSQDSRLPASAAKTCSILRPCYMLNCPFQNHPDSHHIKCLHVTDLELAVESPTFPAEPGNFIETFLNFHFYPNSPGSLSFTPLIAGKNNILPTVPPQIFPETFLRATVPCNETKCAETRCDCTHLLKYPLGSVVQMVLINAHRFLPEGQAIINHPMHMHGHQFQVIKIGWPQYDEDGKYLDENYDVKCDVNNRCHKASWEDKSWNDGNVPGILTSQAPLKDTILIPFGGYVVIRFKADNPGFWFLHCHMEDHNAGGMSLVMQEGDISDMSPAPPSVTRCGDLTHIRAQTNQYFADGQLQNYSDKAEASYHGYQVAIVLLSLTCLCLALALVINRYSKSQGYVQLAGEEYSTRVIYQK